jgi:hypothetical protein
VRNELAVSASNLVLSDARAIVKFFADALAAATRYTPFLGRSCKESLAMVMKSLLAKVVDGHLVLPEEALAMLPAGALLRVVTDSERGMVCVFAKDPMTVSPQTEKLMDALAELSEGLTWEEYSAPVSEDALRKHKDDGSTK